jgi:transcriptional regulator with XRE-family HTH domain
MNAMLPDIGRRLHWLRRMRDLKQSVVAEWAGVTQTTVSRWEHGEFDPEPALARFLLLRLGGDALQLSDGPLRRLVRTSPLAVHLVVDTDHRLLAASPSREQEWGRSEEELLGRPLWRFATEGIQTAEASLSMLGWWQNRVPRSVEVQTGHGNAGLRITPGLMLWERLYLADGTPVRLCTTVAAT